MTSPKMKSAFYYAFVLVLTFNCYSANASVFSYQLEDLGANNYRYIYTIENNGTLPNGAGIELFDILFDPSLYDESSLTVSSLEPILSNWSELFLASAPETPAAYDVLANIEGITAGNTVFGFSVDFVWLGNGIPGNQAYEIYDSLTFDLLESGNTQPAIVPLPSSVICFLSALTFFSRSRITTKKS